MPLQLNGVEYLQGPAMRSGGGTREWADTGQRHFRYQQECPVLKNKRTGRLLIRVQHNNSEWPTFYPLATRSELLQDWG